MCVFLHFLYPKFLIIFFSGKPNPFQQRTSLQVHMHPYIESVMCRGLGGGVKNGKNIGPDFLPKKHSTFILS